LLFSGLALTLLLALAGLAALAVARGITLWPKEFQPPPLDQAKWPPEDRCTIENFDRLQAGMTWAEVEAILGQYGIRNERQMARYRAHKPACPHRYLGEDPGSGDRIICVAWSDGAGAVVLKFDRSGRLRYGIYGQDFR
jgi:hypothetical protein